MTQPRIDTATLIKACIALQAGCDLANIASITIHFSDEVKIDSQFKNFVLSQIADRLTEQEATIRHLRTELCNASAVAMENREVALKLKRSACDTFVELRDLRETIAKLRY